MKNNLNEEVMVQQLHKGPYEGTILYEKNPITKKASIIFVERVNPKNISKNDAIPFVATFNYVEGIDNDTEVKIAGIKIGDVSNITISSDQITVNGYIDRNYDIPGDSIIKIKSAQKRNTK